MHNERVVGSFHRLKIFPFSLLNAWLCLNVNTYSFYSSIFSVACDFYHRTRKFFHSIVSLYFFHLWLFASNFYMLNRMRYLSGFLWKFRLRLVEWGHKWRHLKLQGVVNKNVHEAVKLGMKQYSKCVYIFFVIEWWVNTAYSCLVEIRQCVLLIPGMLLSKRFLFNTGRCGARVLRCVWWPWRNRRSHLRFYSPAHHAQPTGGAGEQHQHGI